MHVKKFHTDDAVKCEEMKKCAWECRLSHMHATVFFPFYTSVCYFTFTPKYIRGEVMLDWQVYWVIIKMQRNFFNYREHEGAMWTGLYLFITRKWRGKTICTV